MIITAKKNNSQLGYTLLELVVVVAIIGILSVVAIPNFKRYISKAKTVEAKIHLAAANIAQQVFYAHYGFYSTCLTHMGFNPTFTKDNRYYTIGFNVKNVINSAAYKIGEMRGVSSGANGCQNGLEPRDEITSFPAGKGHGNNISKTSDIKFSAIGDQSTPEKQTYIIEATGYIHEDYLNTDNMSRFTVNERGQIKMKSPGY